MNIIAFDGFSIDADEISCVDDTRPSRVLVTMKNGRALCLEDDEAVHFRCKLAWLRNVGEGRYTITPKSTGR